MIELEITLANPTRFTFNDILGEPLQIIKSSPLIFQVQSLLNPKRSYYAIVFLDDVTGHCSAEQVWPQCFTCLPYDVEDFPVAQMPVWDYYVIPKPTSA